MVIKPLSVICILLFIGVAFAPSITADVDKPELDVIETDNPTPIALIFQLLNKLRNHKDIKNVESEEDLLKIIESDEELNSIYEQLSGNDCGCEDSSPSWERIWPFPVICLSLTPGLIFGLAIFMMSGVEIVFNMVWALGIIFNCFWTRA